MIIKKQRYDIQNPLGTIYLFPGRGMDPYSIYNFFKEPFKNFNLVTMAPLVEWYPIPNGINNQKSAVDGCKKTAEELAKIISETKGIVGLAGFSAGAAIALETSFLLKNLSFVISCSGTVLDPLSIEKSLLKNIKTKYFLCHGTNDKVFTWEERYLPTKELLSENNCQLFELNMDHRISSDFLLSVSEEILSDFKTSEI